MKKLLWDTFLGLYMTYHVIHRYWRYMWGEFKESIELYGLTSLERSEDFQSRLEWADENFEGLMQKFYQDVVQEMVDRGWCQWHEKSTA